MSDDEMIQRMKEAYEDVPDAGAADRRGLAAVLDFMQEEIGGHYDRVVAERNIEHAAQLAAARVAGLREAFDETKPMSCMCGQRIGKRIAALAAGEVPK